MSAQKFLGFVATGVLAAFAFAGPVAAQSNHEQIVEAYGGEYDPDGLGRYVRSIVDRLEPHANLDRPIRHVTVLNSPIVNAFATPEGGVYVTRGIMALANSEDELAGVIGHEIGHVAEGHGASRQSTSILAGLGSVVLQAAGAGDLAMLGYNVGANLGMASYSRGQEADSDRLGVRYLRRAGYDPYALHDFFLSMRLNERLQETLAGSGSQGFVPRMEFFSTHPNTEGRMDAVYERAQAHGVEEGEIPRTVSRYFDMIDGMEYGDASEQGYVRGRRFVHPDLRFEFEVPEGYRIQNGQSAVQSTHQDGSVIYFDLASNPYGRRDLDRYLRNDVAQELSTNISNMQTFRVNGLEAASGEGVVSQGRETRALYAVAIEADNGQVYRFFMTGPRDGRTEGQRGWLDTVGTFRRLGYDEAEEVASLRIDIVRVQRGETVADLADRMAFDDYREERFRTLNGLRNRDELVAGQDVKIVVGY